MLFMGEEWGSSRPFQFFSSHAEPELATATAEGRKAEFTDHGWDADDIPDPQDIATFLGSKLDWEEISEPGHAKLLSFYRGLITLRRNEPDLADPWLTHLAIDYDEDQRWIIMRRGRIAIACNLGKQRVRVPAAGEVLLQWGEPGVDAEAATLPGHSVVIVRTS